MARDNGQQRRRARRSGPYLALVVLALVAGLASIAVPHQVRGPEASSSPSAPAVGTEPRAVPHPGAPRFLETMVRSEQRLLPPVKAMVECATVPLPWHISPANRDALVAAVERVAVGPEVRAALRRAVMCAPGAVCDNPVGIELLAALPPEARTALYPSLALLPENASYAMAFHFRADLAALRAQLREVDDTTFATLRQYLYPAGDALVLANLPAVCGTIAPAQRPLLIRALNATRALHLEIPVRGASDIDELLAWFHRPEARPLLEELVARGGGLVDVAELLPPFARERLNRYPSDPEPEPPHNCFWTALNFTRATPEPSLSLRSSARAELAARYRPVTREEGAFGDVITFDKDGLLLHGAVLIAGDVYFTRNGFSPMRPWALESLAEMELRYRDTTERWWRPRQP